MTGPAEDRPAGREARIDLLLEAWEEARGQGREVAVEDLCRERPELEAEVRARIRRLERIGGLMERETGPDPSQELEPLPCTEVELSSSLEDLTFLEQGGMGVLGLARDPRLERNVVVKFLRSSSDSPAGRERFLNEARVTGGLDHPGVLPVYGFGRAEGQRPFYAMRHVSGRTLEKEIDEYHRQGRYRRRGEQNQALAHLLGRFVSVAYTIAYAHEQGIVHCDLKPQNILLGSFGETYVIDWGLSVSCLAQDRKTATWGSGTQGYSHPRQLSGDAPPSPAWDIYSLGAILCRLLTGQSPGKGCFRPKRGVPPALASIARHALGEDLDDAYRGAREVAEEVERYLAGEPVRVHSETLGERALRWQRSHQAAAKAAGGLLLLLVAVLAAGLFSLWLFAGAMERQRRESLETAAGFAAQTVALEMNNRWQALRLASRDSRLLEALEGLEAGGSLDGFQEGLQNRIRFHRNANPELRSASWFLCDAEGRQVARSPLSRSLGKNYAHRDYFHGNGRDYAESVPGDPPWIDRPHHSVVYRSTSDDSLKVAYSVPVYLNPGTDSERFLGVIGMSVRLGEFSFVRRRNLQGHHLILADLREDWLEDRARRGLVLHHPGLGERIQESGEERNRPRLEDALVQRLRSLGEEEAGFHLEDFVDPLFPSQPGTWAAFVRVRTESGGERSRDSGWAVIVQEEGRSP